MLRILPIVQVRAFVFWTAIFWLRNDPSSRRRCCENNRSVTPKAKETWLHSKSKNGETMTPTIVTVIDNSSSTNKSKSSLQDFREKLCQSREELLKLQNVIFSLTDVLLSSPSSHRRVNSDDDDSRDRRQYTQKVKDNSSSILTTLKQKVNAVTEVQNQLVHQFDKEIYSNGHDLVTTTIKSERSRGLKVEDKNKKTSHHEEISRNKDGQEEYVANNAVTQVGKKNHVDDQQPKSSHMHKIAPSMTNEKINRRYDQLKSDRMAAIEAYDELRREHVVAVAKLKQFKGGKVDKDESEVERKAKCHDSKTICHTMTDTTTSGRKVIADFNKLATQASQTLLHSSKQYETLRKYNDEIEMILMDTIAQYAKLSEQKSTKETKKMEDDEKEQENIVAQTVKYSSPSIVETDQVAMLKVQVQMLSHILSNKGDKEQDLEYRNVANEPEFVSFLQRDLCQEHGVTTVDMNRKELMLRDFIYYLKTFQKSQGASGKILKLQNELDALKEAKRKHDIKITSKMLGLERDVIVERNRVQQREIELIGIITHCKNLQLDHENVLMKIRQMDGLFLQEEASLDNDENNDAWKQLDKDTPTEEGLQNGLGAGHTWNDFVCTIKDRPTSDEIRTAMDSQRCLYYDALPWLEKIETKFLANQAVVAEAKKAMKTSEQDLQTALRHYSELVAEHEEKMTQQAKLFLVAGYGCSETDDTTNEEGSFDYVKRDNCADLSVHKGDQDEGADSDTFVASETVTSDTEIELVYTGHVSGLDSSGHMSGLGSSGNDRESLDDSVSCFSSDEEQDSIDSSCSEYSGGGSSVEDGNKSDFLSKFNLNMARIEKLEQDLLKAREETKKKQYQHEQRERDLLEVVSRQESEKMQHTLALKRIATLENQLKKSKNEVASNCRKRNQEKDLAKKKIADLEKQLKNANAEIKKRRCGAINGNKDTNNSGNCEMGDCGTHAIGDNASAEKLEALKRKLCIAQREAEIARSRQGQLRDAVSKCKKMDEEHKRASEQITALEQELEMSRKELYRRDGESIGTRKRLADCYSQLKTMEQDYHDALDQIKLMESELDVNKTACQ